jgi:hypothetical protein
LSLVGSENEGKACANQKGRHILISDSFAGLAPKPWKEPLGKGETPGLTEAWRTSNYHTATYVFMGAKIIAPENK